jgi:Zn-dependent protease with chaperone function
MDFFQQQTQARKKTGRLLILFALGVACLIGVTYAILLIVLKFSDARYGIHTVSASAWHPLLLLGVTAALLLVISGGSLYKVSELSGGGQSVALLVGGRQIAPSTRDFAERRLLNIVEEMAIASGMPVPPVYVLEEEGINAFAAGHAPSDAIVAVSRGCLKYLNRDELQGVVGHEFSHILNGDMRLNIRLMGLIFGITVISLIGYFMFRMAGWGGSSSRRDEKGAMVVFLLGLALYILGVGGAFFGQLIRAAVSRQREFLADASSVQFTRNPDGIGGALKKIGGLKEHSRIKHAGSSEIAHMFFADGMVSHMAQMFATHPPLEERIRRVDPHWDGEFIRTRELDQEQERRNDQQRPRRPLEFGAMPSLPGLPQLPIPVLASLDQSQPIDNVEVVATAEAVEPAGPPTISPRLLEAIREPFSARAVIYALLLDPDPAIRNKQLTSLQTDIDPRDIAELRRLEPDVKAVPDGMRMIVAQRTRPALRQMSVEQYKTFRAHVDQLMMADEQISLFEFCLHSLVIYQLNGAFGLRRPPKIRFRSIAGLSDAVASIIGTLAWNGSDDETAVRKAFEEGWRDAFGDSPPPSLPSRSQIPLEQFSSALNQFRHATSAVKQSLIRGCVACIRSDGKITRAEGDLIRAVCSALDYPIPVIGASEV